MNSHFDNLLTHLPDLRSSKILDVGSGSGKFLIQLSKDCIDIIGIEPYDKYRDLSYFNASKENVNIKLIDGSAEKLPFNDKVFDFINLSEVIEHVDDDNKAMLEAYRVLKDGGNVYMSVPSRYSIRDPHVHLYFVNLIPRFLSDLYISIFSKHGDYNNMSAGRHRLKDMNYYRFNKLKNKLKKIGFSVMDIREEKIKKRITNKIIRLLFIIVYRIIRPFYFDTFHLLLKK